MNVGFAVTVTAITQSTTMPELPEHLKKPFINLLLAAADDKLFLGHRNSEWTGLGPILEEDIAFSALAQDEMAHASALYELAGAIDGRSADRLAFGRAPGEYRCAAIVEVPDEFDWATAMARRLFCNHFDVLRLTRLSMSVYKPLADLARRLAAEQQAHVQHVDDWTMRLGSGTPESHRRIQQAIEALARIAPQLFEPVERQDQLVAAGLYPGDDLEMYDAWRAAVEHVLGRGHLSARLDDFNPEDRGGRRGVHTVHLAPMLDEMCEVYRLEPDAAW